MTDIHALYQEKLTTPAGIASLIPDGAVCMGDIALSESVGIIDAIGERAVAENLHFSHHALFGLQPLANFQLPTAEHQQTISWFSGPYARTAIQKGLADVMPAYYRDIPGLIEQYVELDACYLVCSPMDEHGYFSMSTVASVTDVLLSKSKQIFLEVNQNMPRIFSSPMVHISQVTALCERNVPLFELPQAPPDEVSHIIGSMIAQEIPNEATIQIGVGAIPDAVGMALRDKRDLGIHTEMFTNSMVELIQCGAVTNRKKPINAGKSVATFAAGTQKMYQFLHNNPTIDLRPVRYVNDPNVICQHPNFISVNAALEVDFFGQVCAESMGTLHVSGTGGQADFVRGATQSTGGKSFIAFPSTAKGGTVSRIVSTLAPGAIVTTGKNEVDYIATEYGIAKLRGRTLGQRTKALISIAHPKFREELTFQAKQRQILI